jgi:glycosyltransferase involved in cell wall biosynthesis
MKIAAIMMVKNESDIIYHTILHLAEEGVNTILVADNLSTDNTVSEIIRVADLLKDSPCEVVLLQDKEVGYYQSEKMTTLAHKAHNEYGAEWIIPIDADELIYSHIDSVYNTIKGLPENVDVIQMDLYNHFATAIDTEGAIPFETMGWRQKCKGALPKVAVKYHHEMLIKQGNHSVDLPFEPIISVCLELRHFPYRSFEQMKNKAINGAAAYAKTNLPFDAGGHWRSYFNIIEKWGDDVFRNEVWQKYFWFYSPIDNDLIFDPAPFRRWSK